MVKLLTSAMARSVCSVYACICIKHQWRLPYWREMATGTLCVILSHLTVVYSPNDSTCYYNKFEYEFEFYAHFEFGKKSIVW